jgi:hypothetical protein
VEDPPNWLKSLLPPRSLKLTILTLQENERWKNETKPSAPGSTAQNSIAPPTLSYRVALRSTSVSTTILSVPTTEGGNTWAAEPWGSWGRPNSWSWESPSCQEKGSMGPAEAISWFHGSPIMGNRATQWNGRPTNAILALCYQWPLELEITDTKVFWKTPGPYWSFRLCPIHPLAYLGWLSAVITDSVYNWGKRENPDGSLQVGSQGWW